MSITVYLAGEIHTAWRTELAESIREKNLPVRFTGPVTDHDASDMCGVRILGEESNPFWQDRKGAGVNSIRTRTMLANADVVVVKFGEKYRQWNAAFDAGQAVALGKPLIVVHPPEFQHALKEIDSAANAVAETIPQVVDVLEYVTRAESWQG